MNNLTVAFSDVNAGYSTISAPELGGAFAAANTGTLNAPTIGLENNASLDL